MKPSCRYSKGPEAEDLRPLLGQTLLVDYFLNFMEFSPPISISNLCHLRYTIVGEGKEKQKNGVYQGAGKNQGAVLCFPQS